MRTLSIVFTSLLLAATLSGADSKILPLAPGSPAPDFHLPGVDGRTWSLADFADAPVLVVVFTCNHCPTAQAYYERLNQIADDYKAKGVAIVAISPSSPKGLRLDELGYTEVGDSFEEMKDRVKREPFHFPYLYDGDTEAVSKAYGPVATPHVFVFDKGRTLRCAGRIDDNEREELVKSRDLRNALDALLAGKEPPVAQTKAFGCSTKWADKESDVAAYMARLAQEPVAIEPIDDAGLASLKKGEGTKLRLINVWATWCGPCVSEFPELVKIDRMYRQRDFEFVAISADYPDKKDAVLKFLKKEQASNKNYLFGTTDQYALADAFDKEWSGALPYTVLLGSKGEVFYKHEGAIDPLAVKEAILKKLGREMR